MENNHVIKSALSYRKDVLKLDEHEPITDSYKLAEKAGFFIVALPLSEAYEKEKESGFFLKVGSTKFIFVNTTVFGYTQNYTIWHEVYHSLNPVDINEMTQAQIDEDENNAELFSSVILLPPSVLERLLVSNVETNTLYPEKILDIAIKYKLHYRAVLRLIFMFYPQFKSKSYLYSFEGRAEKKLSSNKMRIHMKLKETGKKYISPKIFEAIEENYLEEKIDKEELKKINNLIEEVTSIDNK